MGALFRDDGDYPKSHRRSPYLLYNDCSHESFGLKIPNFDIAVLAACIDSISAHNKR